MSGGLGHGSMHSMSGGGGVAVDRRVPPGFTGSMRASSEQSASATNSVVHTPPATLPPSLSFAPQWAAAAEDGGRARSDYGAQPQQHHQQQQAFHHQFTSHQSQQQTTHSSHFDQAHGEWRHAQQQSSSSQQPPDPTLFDRTTSDISDWLRRQATPVNSSAAADSGWQSHYTSLDSATASQHSNSAALHQPYLASQRSGEQISALDDLAAYDHLFVDTPTSPINGAAQGGNVPRFQVEVGPGPSGLARSFAQAIPPHSNQPRSFSTSALPATATLNNHQQQQQQPQHQANGGQVFLGNGTDDFLQSLFAATRNNNNTSATTASWSGVPANSPSNGGLQLSSPGSSFNVHAAPFSPSMGDATSTSGSGHNGERTQPHVSTILEWDSASESEGEDDSDSDDVAHLRSGLSANSIRSPGLNIRRLAESFLSGVDEEETTTNARTAARTIASLPILHTSQHTSHLQYDSSPPSASDDHLMHRQRSSGHTTPSHSPTNSYHHLTLPISAVASQQQGNSMPMRHTPRHQQDKTRSAPAMSPTRSVSALSGLSGGHLSSNSAGSGSVFRTSPLLDPSGYEYSPAHEERMLSLEDVPFEDGLLPATGDVLRAINAQGGFDRLPESTGSSLLVPIPLAEPAIPSTSSSHTVFSASSPTLDATTRNDDSRSFNLLHNQMISFTRAMHTLQESSLRMREELACRTRWAVRSVWPTAIVSVVGSVCAGVALPKSDLDFVVYFDAASQEAARARYMQQMNDRGDDPRHMGMDHHQGHSPSPSFDDHSGRSRTPPSATGSGPTPSFPPFAHAGSLIKLIGGRKKSKLLFRSTKIQVFKDINLIRLRDGCSGISMDLWFPLAADIHRRSQQHTALIHGYMSAFPAFYPLSCVVKTFMQQHLLNSGYSGLGSYGILLMIVRFLQHHRQERVKAAEAMAEADGSGSNGVLPTEEANLGRLLCAFFRFYIAFDYESLGLDVRADGSFFDKAPLNDVIREQQLREIGAMRAEAEKRVASGGSIHSGPPLATSKNVTATMNAATMSAAVTGSRPSPPSVLVSKRKGRGGDEDDDSGDDRDRDANSGVALGDLDDPALLSHFTLVIQDPQDAANSIICHHKALRNMIHAFAKAVQLLDPLGDQPTIPNQVMWAATGGEDARVPVPTTPGGTEVRDPNVQITLPLLKEPPLLGMRSISGGSPSPSPSPVPAPSRFHALIDAVAAQQGPSQKVCPSSACKRAGPDGTPTLCPTQNKVCFTCGYMFINSTKHGPNTPGGNGGGSTPSFRSGANQQDRGHSHHKHSNSLGGGQQQQQHSHGVGVPPPAHLTTPGAAALAAAMAQQLRLQSKGGQQAQGQGAGFNATQLINFVTMQQRHLLAQQLQSQAQQQSNAGQQQGQFQQQQAQAQAQSRASEIATLRQSVNMLVNAVAAAGQQQNQQGQQQQQQVMHHSHPVHPHHRRTASSRKDDSTQPASSPILLATSAVAAPLLGDASPYRVANGSQPLLTLPMQMQQAGVVPPALHTGNLTPSSPAVNIGSNRGGGKRGRGRNGGSHGGGSMTPGAHQYPSSHQQQQSQAQVQQQQALLSSRSTGSYPVLNQPATQNHRSFSASAAAFHPAGSPSSSTNAALLYSAEVQAAKGSILGSPYAHTGYPVSPVAPTKAPLLNSAAPAYVSSGSGGRTPTVPPMAYANYTQQQQQQQQNQGAPLLSQQSAYMMGGSSSTGVSPPSVSFNAKQAHHLFSQNPLNLHPTAGGNNGAPMDAHAQQQQQQSTPQHHHNKFKHHGHGRGSKTPY